MRKKIGVFLGEITGDFQHTITQAIVMRANSLGYDTVIICTYGSYNDDILYSEGEKACIELPEYESFDGVIVTEDVFDIEGMGDELYRKLMERTHCPIVYLRTIRENCYSLLVENTTSIERVTRHFIEDHGFTDICYMSGKEELLDSKERLQGFLNVMKENDIPVTEHMIFHGDYWREKGEEAVNWFMEGRDTYPQAIICANDYMALSVCDELRKRHVRIPEDVCISGFDYVQEAKSHEPTLTTLAVDFEKMSYRAVEIIDRVNHGYKEEYIQRMPAELKLHNSCKCGEQWAVNVSEMIESNYMQIATMKNVMLSTMEYQDAFEEEEYLWVAEKYRSILKSDRAWLCLLDAEEQEGYSEIENDNSFTEKMILKRIFEKKEKALRPEKCFDRKELLPAEYWSETEPNNFLFFSIHFKNKVYGYMVTEIPKGPWFDIYTQAYFINLGNAIENSVVQRKMENLEEIKALYNRDALTGLYNRRGYDKLLRDRFLAAREHNENFSVVSIDMDGLKYINDHFGHSEGDEAIKELARALKSVLEGEEFCARIGGDEFAAVLFATRPDREKDFVRRFEEAVTEVHDKEKPYPMGASVGMCSLFENPGAPLITYIQKADMRMYENKRYRKEHG